MADPRFFPHAGELSLAEVAARTGSKLVNCPDPTVKVDDVAPLEAAKPSDVSFLENRRYLDALARSGAGACLIPGDLVPRAPAHMALLVTGAPRRNFARLGWCFHPEPGFEPGVCPGARVAASARLGAGSRVEPGAVIGERVEIGEGCLIGANTVINDAVVIGCGTRIGANVTLSHSVIGERCEILPGARIGQHGFGFDLGGDGTVRMPHLGRVMIEDDVEIGANCTIDRGAGPDTRIGRGSMLDNLVHLAHNVQLGCGCIVVAQVGIAGSTRLGDHVVIGGQTGIVGHIDIGDRARIAGRAGVHRNIPPDGAVGGSPAVPIDEWRRSVAILRQLARRGPKVLKPGKGGGSNG
ncbi:MAG: UDP-3-O-(3-hydroxymyristoyl)glucosamine N-acyltransferase [Alphaproteobacteria bacterium]|nr:UDP-3-O-(3-hydroxymyristoyl)glucosamine N-acyltransferase [Alphaproteobacteria bacterium]